MPVIIAQIRTQLHKFQVISATRDCQTVSKDWDGTAFIMLLPGIQISDDHGRENERYDGWGETHHWRHATGREIR